PRRERRALRQAIGLLEIDRRRFALSVLFGSGAIGSGVGLGSVSAWLIARAAQLPPVLDLQVAATAVRMFGIGKAVFRYLERISSHWIALNGMSAIRSAVYNTLADSPTDVVTSIRRGDLLARTGSDVDELGNVVVKSLLPAAVSVVVSLISIGIVAFLSPSIGAVLAACLIISGLVCPWLAMRGARIAEISGVEARAALNAESLMLLENSVELRVSGQLAHMEQARQHTETRIQRERNASAKPTALAGAIDVIALGISVCAALVIGSLQVAAGTLTPIGLVVCTLTPLAAFEATQGLTAAGVQLIRSAAAAVRIMDLLQNSTARIKPSDSTARTRRSDTFSAAHSTSEGAERSRLSARASANESTSLHADQIVIGWPDGPDFSEPLSFTVHKGDAIAVVGPSGIGKSTLLYTLAGMLPPHKGSVLLDGATPLDRMQRAEVSRHVILTAEDAHIFETSVLENLRVVRPDVTPEEAQSLLTRAGLSQWLADLPEGVDTMLGVDGATISGGERRRILLARALASQADILLLDEPGEHLDPQTADALIEDLLRSGGSERGVVLVTHRLSALNAASEVIMLGGSPVRIIARGTHAQLVDTMPEYAWALAQE
ncbi:MAG: thiol reductant ABC exporter subunit CydC, partial [Arcanobacterium sp.]|nr:thiol reductant ABC exporter subunit CydC [Arcanobacterium sp.]